MDTKDPFLSNTESGLGDISPKKRTLSRSAIYAVILFSGLILLYFFLLSAPRNFPEGSIVSIEFGSGLRQVSLELKNQGVIRSRTSFEAFVILFGGEKRVIASSYFFSKTLPVYEVARRFSEGDHRLLAFKVTIPEGQNLGEMSEALSLKLPYFNKEKFLTLTRGEEGYLFPDTYFFFPTDTEDKVIKTMQANYEKKVAPLRSEMLSVKKSEEDIINMAALLEKEAKGDGDRAIISGILWKRLSIGMPLQADAAPETYERKGLPDGPLGNPGLKSIIAAIHPETSPYLYYIHGKDGNTYYARNFEEHKRNIARYLK
ncbi:MAG: endolytic transglycosylase MltG [Candidatus Paceibacterota bacterium]